jgi:hypothetical protein
MRNMGLQSPYYGYRYGASLGRTGTGIAHRLISGFATDLILVEHDRASILPATVRR